VLYSTSSRPSHWHKPPRASDRFLEFFTAQIKNRHTRRAYARAAGEFFDWLEAKGVTQLAEIQSAHVATYIEQLSRARSAPTAELRLAALRHLFDWMAIGQIVPTNPAAAVRGPRHIVRAAELQCSILPRRGSLSTRSTRRQSLASATAR
jgi:site-specific recombinase XerD